MSEVFLFIIFVIDNTNLVAGKFLELLGIIIGVPIFTIIYSIIKEVVEIRLKKKGLNTNTRDSCKNINI